MNPNMLPGSGKLNENKPIEKTELSISENKSNLEINARACFHCEKSDLRCEKIKEKLKRVDDEFPYKCELCDKRFYQKFNLKSHMKLHLAEEIHECHECSKKFKTRKAITKHLKLVHARKTPFKCYDCAKRYKAKDDLRVHMRIHIVDHKKKPRKTYYCEDCETKFVTLKHFQKHSRELSENEKNCTRCAESFDKTCVLKKHTLFQHGGILFFCEDCGEYFTHQKGLAMHVRYHNQHCKISHNCEACGAHFRTGLELKAHSKAHAKVKYKCYFCEKSYKKRCDLSNHTKNSHAKESKIARGEFKCEICSDIFEIHYQLENHCDLMHGKKKIFECHACKHLFFTKHELKYHAVTHAQRTYECDKCYRIFAMEKDLLSHKIKRHFGDREKNAKNTSRDGNFRCEICKKPFENEESCLNHARLHENSDDKSYLCEWCDQIFGQRKLLKLHRETDHAEKIVRFECDVCKITFPKKSLLRKHMYYCHGGGEYKCEICGDQFIDYMNLKTHTILLSHFPKEIYQCPICNHKFAQQNHLTNHIKTHKKRGQLSTPENVPDTCKYLQCANCPKVFTTRHVLIEHLKKHATDSTPKPSVKPPIKLPKKIPRKLAKIYGPMCHVCNLHFPNATKLKSHRNSHYPKRIYKCFICNAERATKVALRNHLIDNHGAEKETFPCPYCGKIFYSASRLYTHKADHKD